MDSACPKELATEILSDSDHSTKVVPTTLRSNKMFSGTLLKKIYLLLNFFSNLFLVENSLVEPRQCDYDGRYYCPKCHWNNTAVIPARVVHNWDFVERPVCCSCSEFLKMMFPRPIINMDKLNPQLFGLVEELSNVKVSTDIGKN